MRCWVNALDRKDLRDLVVYEVEEISAAELEDLNEDEDEGWYVVPDAKAAAWLGALERFWEVQGEIDEFVSSAEEKA